MKNNPLKSKNLSKPRKDSRTDESPSSIGGTSFILSPDKRTSRDRPREKASMESIHNKSSNNTASEDPKKSARRQPQAHMSSISYPNSMHDEEYKANIINKNDVKIEVSEVPPKARMGTVEFKDSNTAQQNEPIKEEKNRAGEESVKLDTLKEGFEQEANKINQTVNIEKDFLSVDKDQLNQMNQSSSQAIDPSSLEETYNADDGVHQEEYKGSEEIENTEQEDQSFHENNVIHSAGISIIIFICFKYSLL